MRASTALTSSITSSSSVPPTEASIDNVLAAMTTPEASSFGDGRPAAASASQCALRTPLPMTTAANPWRCGLAVASPDACVACSPQPKPLLAASQARNSRPGFHPTSSVRAAALSVRTWAANAAPPKVAAPASRRVRDMLGESDRCNPGNANAMVARAAAPTHSASKPTSAPRCRAATLSTAAAHRVVDSAMTAVTSQGRRSAALRWRTRWPMSTLT